MDGDNGASPNPSFSRRSSRALDAPGVATLLGGQLKPVPKLEYCARFQVPEHRRVMGEKNGNRHLVAWVDLLGLASRLEDPRELVVAEILEKVIPAVLVQVNPVIEDRGRGNVGPMVEVEAFQDTVVLWTDPHWINLEILLRACLGLMTALLAEGIPARGAVTIGTLYTSRLAKSPAPLPNGGTVNVVLGSGIARANKLEGSCRFAGIIIDPRLTANTEGQADTADLANFLQGEGAIFCIKYHGRSYLRWPDYMPYQDEAGILDLTWPEPPTEGRAAKIYRATGRFIAFVKKRPGILASAMAMTEVALRGPAWQRQPQGKAGEV